MKRIKLDWKVAYIMTATIDGYTFNIVQGQVTGRWWALMYKDGEEIEQAAAWDRTKEGAIALAEQMAWEAPRPLVGRFEEESR